MLNVWHIVHKLVTYFASDVHKVIVHYHCYFFKLKADGRAQLFLSSLQNKKEVIQRCLAYLGATIKQDQIQRLKNKHNTMGLGLHKLVVSIYVLSVLYVISVIP